MMRTYLGLIPRNLIKNKKRTLALGLSIILSIILITSTQILIKSVVNASLRDNTMLLGKYHASFREIPYGSIDKAKQNKKIDRVATTAFIAQSKIEDSIIDVSGIDDEAVNILSMKIAEGNYPKKDGEAIVERWVLNKIKPGAKIGDKISIRCSIIERQKYGERNEKIKFTLCGILENTKIGREADTGKIYISLNEAEKLIQKNKIVYYQYFTVKNDLPVRKTVETLKDEFEGKEVGEYAINESYLRTIDTTQKAIKVAFLLDVIIALIASTMVYNIFNISIIERLRYFGMLRAIGITPWQIKSLVFGEEILFGILLIPLGIVSGANLTEFLVNGIGGNIGSRKLVIDSTTYNITAITVIGFLSIIAAAYKPARLASRVSPIEALSENQVIDNEIKKEGLIQKTIKNVSGYLGNLAYMNIKRNRRRFFSTVMSIGMGVMLFIAINYFVDSIDPINEIKKEVGSDYIINEKETHENIGLTDNQINEIKNINGVCNIKKYVYISGYGEIEVENLTKEGIKFGEKYGAIKGGKCDINISIIGCSKEEMERLRKDINIKAMRSIGKPEAIIVQNINNKRLTNIQKGEIIKVGWSLRGDPIWEHIEGEFSINGVLSEVPFKLGFYDTKLILIAEEEEIRQIFGIRGYQRIAVDVDTGIDNNKIKKELYNIIDNQKGSNLISFYDDVQKLKTAKSGLIVILYALFYITLIITLVNIINTISMNIITRKREFGMLRAVGMTKGQLRMMIIKEGIIYGFTGSMIGSLLGVLLSFLVYKAANGNMFQDMVWEIHYGVITAVFIVAMVITTITTLIPLKRATSMNVVEAVKSIE